MDFPRHGIMHVRFDDFAYWMLHEAQLLGEIVGGEKVNALLVKFAGYYDCYCRSFVVDIINEHTFSFDLS
jgi:hypothetical protein